MDSYNSGRSKLLLSTNNQRLARAVSLETEETVYFLFEAVQIQGGG